MQVDKTKFYMLGPNRKYEEWVWGEDPYYADYIGPQKRWIEIQSCFEECCGSGEHWEIDSKTEEEFQEYLDSLPEDEVSWI